MTSLVFIVAAAIAITATTFVVLAFLWLKKLRETVSSFLGETASQHIKSIQRMNESLAQIEKRLRVCEQQIHALAGSNAFLRKEMESVVNDKEASNEQDEPQPVPVAVRTVH